MITAEAILVSRSPEMKDIGTLKLRYPKFIHGEFMTHRVFSRNASSSRAIPTAKLIEEVRSDALRAGPVFWGKNQPGMQAAEELSSIIPPGEAFSKKQWAMNAWAAAAYDASIWAERLVELGVHKQIVNRILEPFSHINVVVTSTEWDNFFGLRLDAVAQPEMRELANKMWDALHGVKIGHLEPGEWHLPFVGPEDNEWIKSTFGKGPNIDDFDIPTIIKVSVARCARVSYLSNDTQKRSTLEEDLKLYDRLMGSQPIHASPAEHQATPDAMVEVYGSAGAEKRWETPWEHGNFKGWRQYRKMVQGEAVAPLPDDFIPF